MTGRLIHYSHGARYCDNTHPAQKAFNTPCRYVYIWDTPRICLSRYYLDLHILLNTIHAPSILNSPASASWIPVCLPKFNPSGFVNAYISFLQKSEEEKAQGARNRVQDHADAETPIRDCVSHESGDANNSFNFEAVDQRQNPPTSESGIALVCISGGGEFETVRMWCDTVTKVRFLRSSDIWWLYTYMSSETRERWDPRWDF